MDANDCEEDAMKTVNKFKLSLLMPVLFVCTTFNVVALSSASNTQNLGNTSTPNNVDAPHLDTVWVADTAAFPASKRIYLAPAEASFSSSWLSDFTSKTTESYRKNTLNNYAKTLHEKFSYQLQKSGWTVLETPQSDSLTATLRLHDIYILAPDSKRISTTLVASVGTSRLYLDLIGTDNKTIFKVEDARSTGGLDNAFIEANRAINYAWFKRLMGDWAIEVTPYIDMLADVASKKADVPSS